MNADGSNQRNLTQHPALDTKPSWSPDGHRLAFASSRSGLWEIYVIDISSGEVEQLTDSTKVDGYASSPSWSPDGKHIAYELARNGKGRDIYIMDADGKNARSIANREEPLIRGNHTILRHFPRWSPDGKRILYTEIEYAPGLKPVASRLVVRRSDGSNPQVLPTPKGWRMNAGCWASDGAEILFGARENGLVKPGGNYEIYRYNRFSGKITNLTNHPSSDYGPDWLSDNLSVSPGERLSTLWGVIKRERSSK
jgi:Tol biopolymer transport system component